jgi:hypothetical protein
MLVGPRRSLASAAKGRVTAGMTLAIVVAVTAGAVAQSRRGATAPSPAWVVCAGGGATLFNYPVRRLTALADKARVEQDIARVFAQREKEQRVSPANLGKARLSIDFLYAAGEGVARQFYYEASKTIPDAEGLLRVSVSGWLRGDGGLPRSLGSKGELQWIELSTADPDGDLPLIPEPPPIPEPAASLVPQGVLASAGEHIWAMRRGIGSGPLLVYEVSPRGVWLRPKSSTKACS